MIYPTVPLRATPFIRNMKRLGQNGTNRLGAVRVGAIIRRVLIDYASPANIDFSPGSQSRIDSLTYGRLSPDEIKILQEIRKNPTPEELQDLALIDTVYISGASSSSPSGSYRLQPNVECQYERVQWFINHHIENAQINDSIEKQRSHPIKGVLHKSDDPFFCTQPVLLPENYVIDNIFGGDAAYFKLLESDTWDVAKGYVQNMVAILTALQDYPFPSPIPIMPTVAYLKLQDDLVKLVHSDIPLTPYAARVVITLLILHKYDEISEKIMDELKAKEKRQRWKSLVKKFGLAATLAVIGAGIASALTPLAGAADAARIAQGVKAVTGYTISSAEQKKAAGDIANAAKLFETSDAGYSAELYEASNVLDQLAADQIRNGPLSDEMRAALEELGLNPPLQPSDVGGPFYPSLDSLTSLSTETLLIAGGAVVVAGIIVYALLA